MIVRKFSAADAHLERSPGQDAAIFVGNVVDQRQQMAQWSAEVVKPPYNQRVIPSQECEGVLQAGPIIS